MDKEVVHIYAMEYYTAKEKNEIKPFVAAWMDPEIIPKGCGIFLDQGSNLCPLHWQADS